VIDHPACDREVAFGGGIRVDRGHRAGIELETDPWPWV